MDKAIKTEIHARASLAQFREMAMGMTMGMAMLFAMGTAVSGQTMPPNHMPDPSSNPPASTSTSTPPGDDITRRDVADMDQFLDGHPEIAQQLRKDPSLIDNRRWVSDHAALQEYLQNHPQIARAFRTHPEAFMRDENRYERTEGDRDRDRISRKDVAEMDRFLDSHPEIAEQLRKDPSLIDNRQWVASHPALQEYLQSHTEVREAFRSDPNLFMKDENRYERTEGDRDHDRDRDERNRGEFTSFGQFLGGHSNMAAELSADPTLATNKEYLASHPELNEYLKAHPTISQQLAENPQAVMTSNLVQQGSGFTAKPVGPTPRPKSSNPTPNQ